MNVRTARARFTRSPSKRTTSLGELIAAFYDAATELSHDARQASVLAIDAIEVALRHQHAGLAIGHGSA